jgi:hypothetical protein
MLAGVGVGSGHGNSSLETRVDSWFVAQGNYEGSVNPLAGPKARDVRRIARHSGIRVPSRRLTEGACQQVYSQEPAPPARPGTYGQHTSPYKHGLCVPLVQVALRFGGASHEPRFPQYPVQQSAQPSPQLQYAGQAFPRPVHPPPHCPRGVQTPAPPGVPGLLAQQTSPCPQACWVPVEQPQPS